MARWGWLGLALSLAAGCGPPANPQQLRQEALTADPAFADVLQKRDEAANRITLQERELAVKRSRAESEIARLRQELKAATDQAAQKTTQLKAQLDPDRQRVDLAYSMASEELRAKRQQRASLGRSISQLRKTLKDPKSAWTDSERGKMDRDMADLTDDAQRLDQEISAINQHIRLLKIKRLLLRI